jgi:hypothetical protein
MSTLTFRGHQFHIPLDYPAGHVCTIGEAQALNILRAENLRNNLVKWIEGKLAGFGPMDLPDETYAEIAERVAKYASEYEFRAREIVVAPTLFQLTLRELAEAWVEEQSQMGHIKMFSPEIREAEIVQAQGRVELQAKARAKVRAIYASSDLSSIL